MSKPDLGAALRAGQFVVAPGIHDMIAAVVSNEVGFDFVYASGFWLTASAYGLPDAGIATYTQMLDRVSTLTRTVKAGVIADADTGYGGLLNVHHTVLGYEAAGVVAIQIEDQEFPKKCGHTPNKRVVPVEDMVEKVKVACAARRKADGMLVIARTDARQTDGFEGAVRRGLAYGEAGADIVFLEALESEDGNARSLRADTKADDGEHGGRGEDADPLRGRTGGNRLRAGDFPFDHRARIGRGDGKGAANPQGGRHQRLA